MAKYRKKPVVIEAVQFTEAMACGTEKLPTGVIMARRDIGPPPERRLIAHRHVIDTLEGKMQVEIGDWVITGVKGEVYPYKPDIFAATYDPAE